MTASDSATPVDHPSLPSGDHRPRRIGRGCGVLAITTGFFQIPWLLVVFVHELLAGRDAGWLPQKTNSDSAWREYAVLFWPFGVCAVATVMSFALKPPGRPNARGYAALALLVTVVVLCLWLTRR